MFRRGTSWAARRRRRPNDLEPAALAVEPRLAAWRDRLGAATGRPPVLAGSGATWFVEGDFGAVAAELAPATVRVTRTL